MKKIKYWCPNCKKLLECTIRDEVLPTNMMCAKCFGQVWRRDIEEDKDAK